MFKSERSLGVYSFGLRNSRLTLIGNIVLRRLSLRRSHIEHFHVVYKNLCHITADTVLVIIATITDTALDIELIALMNVFFDGFG